ncbi:MAG: AAA family ATPase [Candidatus Dadabacteria bacterium]|nr:AAA family ATPase [Candidatus Dadabacteria bacterium]
MGGHFFKSIKIENFRGIKSLQADNLARVNLFVGRNSCGKTSFLESLYLLTGMSNPELIIRIENLRGVALDISSDLKDFFYEQNHERGLVLVGDHRSGLQRKLEVYPAYGSLSGGQVLPEPVNGSIDSNKEGSVRARVSSFESIRSLVGLKYKFSSGEAGKEHVGCEAQAVFRLPGRSEFNFSFDEKYKETLRGLFLNSSSTLYEPSFVDKMINKKLKREMLSWLQSIEPKIQDVTMQLGGLVAVDIGLPNLIPVNLLGDGLMRILYVLSGIHAMEDGILMIDEIENGLHVSSVKNMWQMVLEHSEKANTQVFMTTHSRDVIEALQTVQSGGLLVEEDSVACFWLDKLDTDEVEARRYSPSDIEKAIDAGIDIRH